MITFYIEIVLDYREENKNRFRLQSDKINWRKVEIGEPEGENDFLSFDIYELTGLQNKYIKPEVNGAMLKTVPANSKNEFVHYDVFAIRSMFPKIPSREQLVSVIRQGDERIDCSLILNISGFFELRVRRFVNASVKDPSIVLRYETFGEGDVGEEVAEDDAFIDKYYSSAIEHWLYHLKTGATEYYTDSLELTQPLAKSLHEIEEFKILFEEKIENEEHY